MAGEAQRTTLGEAAELLTGFPFKSAAFSDAPHDFRLLRGDNIVQGKTRWDGVKRWPSEDTDQYRDYLLRPGDVVLAMDRPWIEAGLKHATLTQADCPSLLVQRVARLRARPGVDQRFLGYVVHSSDFTNYVLGVQTGTAVPHISGGQIKSYEFLLPPLPQQEGAANLLGALDDKVELNRRSIETLEAMALALFKSWFVDFDPIHAKVEGRSTGLSGDLTALFPDTFGEDGLPEGWRREPLLYHARLISGGTPKTEETAYWDGSILWASAKDVSQCPDHFLITTERTITERGLEESATRLIPQLSTVVVARGATTGRYCMAGRDMAMNQTCYALSSRSSVPFWLCCTFGRTVDELIQAAHGSVFDTITTATLGTTRVTTGDDAIIKAFEELVSPLFRRILTSIEESLSLKSLRDTLLPKLISGELRIADAEKRTVAA
jgi:type I restriction enzyme, S subunit